MLQIPVSVNINVAKTCTSKQMLEIHVPVNIYVTNTCTSKQMLLIAKKVTYCLDERVLCRSTPLVVYHGNIH